MEFYDSRYFFINKFLCKCFGIWPFDTKKKYFLRCLPIMGLAGSMIPHFIGMVVNFSNIDRLMEHIAISIFVGIVLLKLITVIIAENQMEIMFKELIVNWNSIDDEEEKNILKKYSGRGRLLTIGYIGYITNCTVFFTFLPMIPIIINKMRPESEPLPRLFLMNAEFLVDRNNHYWKIYFWDVFSTCVTSLTVVTVDTTFTACVEHCVGLFVIIRHRLRALAHDDSTVKTNANTDPSYDQATKIIQLHLTSLRFVENLDASYSPCFLAIMISNLVLIPLMCVMIIMNADQPIQLFRYFMVFTGLTVHLFYLSLAGEKIIHYSSELYSDVYYNEWYETSKKTKMALLMFMLRCTQPCTLTAGGLMIMGMETFFKITKTAASYITVLASFRQNT